MGSRRVCVCRSLEDVGRGWLLRRAIVERGQIVLSGKAGYRIRRKLQCGGKQRIEGNCRMQVELSKRDGHLFIRVASARQL
jgi:hypothetical protein